MLQSASFLLPNIISDISEFVLPSRHLTSMCQAGRRREDKSADIFLRVKSLEKEASNLYSLEPLIFVEDIFGFALPSRHLTSMCQAGRGREDESADIFFRVKNQRKKPQILALNLQKLIYFSFNAYLSCQTKSDALQYFFLVEARNCRYCHQVNRSFWTNSSLSSF